MNTTPSVVCDGNQRRLLVRERGINGLDYVDVADGTTLTLYFFGEAPSDIQPGNLVLSGGARVLPKITDLRLCSADNPDRVNCVLIIVDRPGDDSTYTLSVQGLEGFDARYSSVDFRFNLDCPSGLDCAKAPQSDLQPRSEPDLSYLTKDYSSFRQMILDRMALNLPAWQEQHLPDFGIVLVELMAYAADSLSYYQDAVATEAYLNTARHRISVRRHLRLIDYQLGEGCNARTWITLETDSDVTLSVAEIVFSTGAPTLGPPVAQLKDLLSAGTAMYEYFEPVQTGSVNLYAAHNSIGIYGWGNQSCRLMKGATAATLLDGPDATASAKSGQQRALRDLRPGMFLLFEEVINPVTGSPDDADPTHRHIVRLEKVEPAADSLTGSLIVDIEWSAADALPFTLVISALTPPTNEDLAGGVADPDECIAKAVSVARGNLVLADHGRTIAGESLGSAPLPVTEKTGCRGGRVSTVTLPSTHWRPRLTSGPLTFSASPSAIESATSHSAAQLLTLGSGTTIPAVSLTDTDGTGWLPQPDLLRSSATDQAFVAEIDDNGFAQIRFGDGTNGAAPLPGASFSATYRVGNGISGNVGAGAIATLAFRDQVPNGLGIRVVRNPLPASGGTDPEPVSTARLSGPFALKNEIERAVTADDYAALAERDSRVQRAAATLRWTGHRAMVRVAIDAFGTEDPSNSLLKEIDSCLLRYRRIGHDVEVVPALYVPLDLEMTVCVKPDWLRGHVEVALLDLFSNRTLADGSTGLFHPDRLTFGQSIYASQLIAAAMGVDGVETVKITRLARMFSPPASVEQNGVLRMGPLEIPRLDNSDTIEDGLLTLTMAGGR